MNGLPTLKYKTSPHITTQNAFGGLNRRASAEDGEITDMLNMSSDEYPILSPRKPRTIVEISNKYNGIFSLDGIVTVTQNRVYYNGYEVGTVSDSKKTITALGSKVVIFPDKVYFDTSAENPALQNMESSVKNIKANICDGEYAEEEAKANTIYAADVNWGDYFKVGDAVIISGASIHTQNNLTIVIREIDGDYLRFYENSFIIGEGGDEEYLTISRTVPDMDYVCECDNRLWGCKADTVYASKLGDLTNWNVFDGLASDSYAVDVGSPGDFTGAITYLGYPIFFKEDVIYKAYGSQPSNFQLIRSASLGVSPGNARSLAIAGEILFYASRIGIVGYSGATPYNISLPLDSEIFTDCVAGSDGKKYYASFKNASGKTTLAVYDTSYGTWHIEDDISAVGFAYHEGLHIMTSKKIYKVNEGTEIMSSYVEFADSTFGSPLHKTLQKIALRFNLDEHASITVKVKYDTDTEWKNIKTLSGAEKRSRYLPVIPRRCDYFKLRIEGEGMWQLLSVTREFSQNSMKGDR